MSAAGELEEIERLRARVARLEALLTKRSEMMRRLIAELCADDLVNASRLAGGLPPLGRTAFGLGQWRETTALTTSDVDKTLQQLWRSLSPRESAGA